MKTLTDENTYTLPNEVIEVRKIFPDRTGFPCTGGGDGGTLFESSATWHILTLI